MRLVVCNRKGGSGKTTIAVNVACELARHGQTLLLDLDSQGDASAWLDSEERGTTTARALTGAVSLRDAARQTAIPNLYVAAAGSDLAPLSLTLARDAIERAVRSTGADFAHVVLDCPPHEDRIVESALTMTQAQVIVPVDGPAAIRNAERVRRAMTRLRSTADIRLVLSRFAGSRLLDREMLSYVEDQGVMGAAIRESVVIRESFGARMPLLAYAPSHPATRDFAALTAEVLDV